MRNNKTYKLGYFLIIFWLITLFSNINRFILHYKMQVEVFILYADISILLFGIGVLLNLIGKLRILSFIFMILGIVGHIIYYKNMSYYVIIIDTILCVILLVESFITKIKNKK